MAKQTTPKEKPLDLFTACSICEGFCGGENASREEQIRAWQFIIDTKAYLHLQGFYGRTAKQLIEAGICHA